MSAASQHNARKHHGLSYPWPKPPEPGTVRPIGEGVGWLRMPMPFSLNHINLWILDDGAPGFTVVDTGIDVPETRAVWDAVRNRDMVGRPVHRVLCTHYHPDHMGLAGWMVRDWGAKLWASRGEWAMGRIFSTDDSAEVRQSFYQHWVRTGLGQADARVKADEGNGYMKIVQPLPTAFTALMDGAHVHMGGRTWEVIIVRGHVPEQALLYDRDGGLLIGGDQVLPGISPNISVMANEPDADPLTLFLDSLTMLRERVPEDVTVLPSHGLVYQGLYARMVWLRDHHYERLDTLAAALSKEPQSTMDLLPVLFPHVPEGQMFFAAGETMAHAHRLLTEGRAKAIMDAVGVERFVAA